MDLRQFKNSTDFMVPLKTVHTKQLFNTIMNTKNVHIIYSIVKIIQMVQLIPHQTHEIREREMNYQNTSQLSWK